MTANGLLVGLALSVMDMEHARASGAVQRRGKNPRLENRRAIEEMRRARQAKGLCKRCAKPSPEHPCCDDCRAKDAARLRKARAKKQRLRLYMRAWRAAKAAAGLCQRCGKRPGEPGRKYCQECTDRA
jgi:hypothetical protein